MASPTNPKASPTAVAKVTPLGSYLIPTACALRGLLGVHVLIAPKLSMRLLQLPPPTGSIVPWALGAREITIAIVTYATFRNFISKPESSKDNMRSVLLWGNCLTDTLDAVGCVVAAFTNPGESGALFGSAAVFAASVGYMCVRSVL